MLIEVSHESPISALKKSLKYNDYCYALVHLFETHSNYYNFFEEAKLLGKEVYLDNSIFELGTSFDPEKYSKWIEKLQPNVYIVPDVLEDTEGTINQWISWEEKYHFPECRTMGVVQGKTWQELRDCYHLMSECADMIAISFDYTYYLTTGEGDDKLQLFSSGRKRFIQQLIDAGIWNWDKPHHLLGCSLAREFRYYVDNNVYNIKSVDTSNPIIAAMHQMKYNDEFGLTTKPKTLLADMIEHELSEQELQYIDYNTRMFKKILRR